MSDSFNSYPSGSLVPEIVDVKLLEEKLKVLWDDGRKYGLMEDMLLETFIHDGIFEEKFNEINKSLLQDLSEKERKEVIDQVKNLLRAASEETLLDYLKYGIDVTIKRSEKRTFILIDFENLERNKYVYVHNLKFSGSPENVKPDFTLLVNGIPLVAIEVEPSTKMGSVYDGIEQIRRYEEQSPNLFRFIQLGVAYGDRKLYLPTFPNWEREKRLIPAQPWKVEVNMNGKCVKEEDIHNLLRPDTILNIIRWYTFFRVKAGEKDKLMGRYNQYIASEKAFDRMSSYLDGSGERNGLIWHWQGSGKTYTMFFIANKFFEKFFNRDPLVFFILDRKELQDQLLKKFLKGLKAQKFMHYLNLIESIDDLKKVVFEIKRSEYMRGIITRGIYVVLIQKFRREDFETLLEDLGNEYIDYLRQADTKSFESLMRELGSLSSEDRERKIKELGGIKKKEIVLLIDEAHRSQYGLLASVMKNIFLNAMRFAFTGTPVFSFEKNTFLEFAYPPKEYYSDVYFLRDSIEDQFTLPITYEVVQEGVLEGVKILLSDDEIKEYVKFWKEASDEERGSIADDVDRFLEFGEQAEDIPRESPLITKSEIRRHLTNVKLFLTNEERLRKLAEYIARRIKEDTENFRFKAMVVAANREACVHLKRFLDEALLRIYGSEYKDVNKCTEIVMTYQQNDRGVILSYKQELIERRKKKDTDDINSDIQDEFKEKENPKILIVTDMLITGFDAPKLKVMYLDKPLYEHRLLQAIARVNRPYEDGVVKKEFGLIVDSVGLLNYVKESIRKFELIAQGEIVSDLEENLLGKVEERVEEFKKLLNDAKLTLRTFSLEGKDLSIDVEEIKEKLRGRKADVLGFLTEVVDPRVKLMAALWDRVEVQRLLNLLRDVVNQFHALGSNEEKMHYVESVDVLAYIYGKLLFYIRGERLPREFWDGLIERIHEKTLVDEFNLVVRTKITNEVMKKFLNEMKRISASELVPDRNIADAYRLVRSLLEEEPANPVYKKIKERIERAREEWIARNIEPVEAFRLFMNAMEMKIEYDEKISTMTLEEKIVETIKMLLTQRFAKEMPLELKEFKNILSEVAKSARIVAYHEMALRTSLMKDLFREVNLYISGVPAKVLKDFAEGITSDYVVKELMKAKERG